MMVFRGYYYLDLMLTLLNSNYFHYTLDVLLCLCSNICFLLLKKTLHLDFLFVLHVHSQLTKSNKCNQYIFLNSVRLFFQARLDSRIKRAAAAFAWTLSGNAPLGDGPLKTPPALISINAATFFGGSLFRPVSPKSPLPSFSNFALPNLGERKGKKTLSVIDFLTFRGVQPRGVGGN